MKTVQFTEHGDWGVLGCGGFPGSEVNPDRVLVDMKTASLNHLDTWAWRGLPGVGLKMPHIPGNDMAGIVTEVDEHVTRFEAGGRVALITGIAGDGDGFFRKSDSTLAPNFHIIGGHVHGIHAEFATIPEENLVPVPGGVPWEVAGSASLVFQITWWILVDRGELRPNKKALVLGTFGGAGHAAVQIADYAGAEVYATASTDEKLEYAEECGVGHVINYEEDGFPREI